MFETLTEILPELLYTLLAGALALLGLFTENLGVQNLTNGHTTMGLWMVAVGIVALYAGFKLAHEKVLPGIRAA
jgi:hypothetical protein